MVLWRSLSSRRGVSSHLHLHFLEPRIKHPAFRFSPAATMDLQYLDQVLPGRPFPYTRILPDADHLRQAATAGDDRTRMLQSKVEALDSTNIARLSEIRRFEMQKMSSRSMTTNSRQDPGWDIQQIKSSVCDGRMYIPRFSEKADGRNAVTTFNKCTEAHSKMRAPRIENHDDTENRMQGARRSGRFLANRLTGSFNKERALSRQRVSLEKRARSVSPANLTGSNFRRAARPKRHLEAGYLAE
ncbi:hypothetical protein V8D89_003501 [Ganoderma adspersum]